MLMLVSGGGGGTGQISNICGDTKPGAWRRRSPTWLTANMSSPFPGVCYPIADSLGAIQ